MRIGVPRERRAGERRVALTPTAVASLVAKGIEVRIESGAGEAAGHLDGAYTGAGAKVANSSREVCDADLIARVGPPTVEEIEQIPEGAAVVGFLNPFSSMDLVRRLADRHLTAVAFEAMPRTTQAQSMDALSSQATAAGYAAAVMAAHESAHFFPMLTTAAGTVRPAKVLVLGAGVAGLQAIATARRLGARVSGYDIRPEAREQIESLGARALDDETIASSGVYAEALPEDAQERQHALLSPHVADSDVVIATAAVPGKPAPILITHEMVHRMHAAAVIVDAAAPSGGNCEVTHVGDCHTHGNGVKICGPTDLASHVAADASQLYARNTLALLERLLQDGELHVDLADPVVGPACVAHRGDVRHPLSRKLLNLPELAEV